MRHAAAVCVLALAACPDFDDAYERCVLEGRCRDLSILSVTVAPKTVSFEAAVGSRVTRELVVTSAAGTVTPELLLSVEGDGFTLASDPCSGLRLWPGGTCKATLRFTASAAGRSTGLFKVVTRSDEVGTSTLDALAIEGSPLHITLAGPGAGSVTAGDGKVCPPACDRVLSADGGGFTLTAQPASGSRFGGWSQDCSGAGACVVQPGAPRNVTATFEPPLAGAVLQLSATGPGRISVTPAGASCGPHCLRFPNGSQVMLTAAPLGALTFASWSGDCSGTSRACALTMSTDRSARAEFAGPNVVFTTSSAILPGLIGGLDGGDAFCEAHAADGGLHQPFVAWLSTPSASAISRLGSARGWVHSDGVPFADQLPSYRIYYPPELDEHGEWVTGGLVATGTTNDGTVASDHCSGWTTTGANFRGGNARGGTVEWTDDRIDSSLLPMFRSCGMSARVYCLTADRSVPVPARPIPDGGRLFFLASIATSGDMQGLQGADRICNDFAADAGLPGTYVAWLKPDARPPAARVRQDGGDWFRPDGVKLATVAGMLAPEPVIYSTPNVRADSVYVFDRSYAWLGDTASDGGVDNCNGWTSVSADRARHVDYLRTDVFSPFRVFTAHCSTSRPFFCAQL